MIKKKKKKGKIKLKDQLANLWDVHSSNSLNEISKFGGVVYNCKLWGYKSSKSPYSGWITLLLIVRLKSIFYRKI